MRGRWLELASAVLPLSGGAYITSFPTAASTPQRSQFAYGVLFADRFATFDRAQSVFQRADEFRGTAQIVIVVGHLNILVEICCDMWRNISI